ncbi:hypothetical protein GCM10011380_31060 [Sphingomonas metalli]|uniref:Flagellar basal body P-ring formation protein FlgA n=1 Tax=Sphingomonas metalli TaxID=1779358 RepID=A0A916TCK6_9SPHN|nr:hypothetical protein [Sphingomonas metalli]GGB39360.1 hypothetical protein GCM10011380_31060 [Sphingomonas metalli]
MLVRLLAAAWLVWASPAAGQDADAPVTPPAVAPTAILPAPPVADADLATMTGKFLLPGGGALALSITSDTMVNGALVLRTVLTVDQGSNLAVFGRAAGVPAVAAPHETGASAAAPSLAQGVSVLFDRRAGTQIVMPTVTTVRAAGATGIGDARPAGANAQDGVVPIAVVAGGPAIATPDGLVTLSNLPRGAQVTLEGDRLGIAHLVGQSVGGAVLNAGNDRVIDHVTTIGIDLKDASALAMGSAAMRVDAVVTDLARGMVR